MAHYLFSVNARLLTDPMDIKPPANPQTPLILNKPVENLLALKVGQKIDAKVINALVKSETNDIALKIGNQTVTVQSNQPIKLESGQNIQIQVIRLIPVIEFAISGPLADPKGAAPIIANVRLILVPATSEKANTAAALPVNQPLTAKITGITGSKIQLQVFTATDNSTRLISDVEPNPDKSFIVITVDRGQLQNIKTATINPSTSGYSVSSSTPETKTADPAAALKIGQSVTVEVNAKGTTPEIKIFAAEPTAGEKITALIKQLLPKHETSSILLNQLMHDLPQLLKNSNVPELLKRLAAELLQNLPQQQQLTESAVLKQSVLNSGVFLEAKLLQLNDNPTLNTEQDFKADLLKFAHELKKEAANPSALEAPDDSLTLVKNLQQKTENTLAKIILDQLTSLPKDEGTKQLWTFDLPFVDRGQAQTASIQIQCNQENSQTFANDKWSVTITMAPPGLGTIQCKLSYTNDAVNTFFRSQHTGTAKLIGQHLDRLKQQLQEAGLKTGIINSQDGIQPSKSVFQMSKTSLLDEKA